jgi:hypothetical protein
MERQELESILEDRVVLNTLARMRRDLQRMEIPKSLPSTKKRLYGHHLRGTIGLIDSWYDIYQRLVERDEVDEKGIFADYAQNHPRRYELSVNVLLRAINDDGATI